MRLQFLKCNPRRRTDAYKSQRLYEIAASEKKKEENCEPKQTSLDFWIAIVEWKKFKVFLYEFFKTKL